MKPTEWQEEANSCWITTIRRRCSICGKRDARIAEMSQDGGDIIIYACFSNNVDCLRKAHERFFCEVDDDYVAMRLLRYRETKTRRRSVGRAKRYNVLERDGFRCVKCGDDARTTTLEVDHIIPFVGGGSCDEDNLQTLCFDCNRGKRDRDHRA